MAAFRASGGVPANASVPFMRAVRILWVDLCAQPTRHRPCRLVSAQHEVGWIDRTHCPLETARRVRPALACVEFDYPDKSCLRVVDALRRAFPRLPLLVLTEYHSEALAVWAFRTGVWDYRVKPIEAATLARSIEVMAAAGAPGAADPGLCRRLPADLIEPAGHLRQPPTAAHRTAPAVSYIANHFEGDLTRRRLADLCHLSVSEFSRAFHREQGTTFEWFLLEYRIAQARELLVEGPRTIAAIAYAVGFRDPDYFCRVFRRLVGTTASEYRRRAGAAGGAASAACGSSDRARQSVGPRSGQP